ncbi:MAG: RHS repeat-associated core domain-containing protein [Thermodesulfobacteriota bacterium]|nr:RHS repeat-associated core domain-containing protein [Thermodesulfobacteriota bacterium]
MIEGSNTYYFHKDHLGSTRALTDANGAVAETMEYLPFGGESEPVESPITKYRYTDQEYDVNTGLYNYVARLYDPVIGTFITPDTITPNPYDPQTLNRYTYCRNNPLIYVDPSGHSMISSIMARFQAGCQMHQKVTAAMRKGIALSSQTRLSKALEGFRGRSGTRRYSAFARTSPSVYSSSEKAREHFASSLSGSSRMRASIWIREYSRDMFWKFFWLREHPGLGIEDRERYGAHLDRGCIGIVAMYLDLPLVQGENPNPDLSNGYKHLHQAKARGDRVFSFQFWSADPQAYCADGNGHIDMSGYSLKDAKPRTPEYTAFNFAWYDQPNERWIWAEDSHWWEQHPMTVFVSPDPPPDYYEYNRQFFFVGSQQ